MIILFPEVIYLFNTFEHSKKFPLFGKERYLSTTWITNFWIYKYLHIISLECGIWSIMKVKNKKMLRCKFSKTGIKNVFIPHVCSFMWIENGLYSLVRTKLMRKHTSGRRHFFLEKYLHVCILFFISFSHNLALFSQKLSGLLRF